MIDEVVVAQINASSVSKWLACAKRAEHDMEMPEERDSWISVNTVVGSMLHAKLGNQEYIPPNQVTWTKDIPTMRAAHARAGLMRSAAEGVLAGYELIEAERRLEILISHKATDTSIRIVGVIDLVMNNRSGGLSIIEVKTGKRPPASSMTQLAVQCWLWSQLEEREIEEVGVLWTSGRNAEAQYQKRDFEQMAIQGKGLLASIRRQIYAPDTLATPSQITCSSCRLKGSCDLAWKDEGTG